MRISICFVLFLAINCTISAQPKTLRIDISETHAQYQNAFKNLTQAYNLLVRGYKKSSRPSDVHYYFQSAKKYVNDTKRYLEKAVTAGEQFSENTQSLGCKKGLSKIQQMKQNFKATDAKMDSAIKSLDAGIVTEDLQELGTHLQGAVQSLQSGVQKLNLAMEELNGATAELRGCKQTPDQ